MPERVLSEIWIYPIKSLAGVRVKHARVLPKGLAYDRRWMLVDAQGRFLTQREHPNMALFNVLLEGGYIKISHPESSESITLNLEKPILTTSLIANIWEDNVEVIETDSALSDWFSGILKNECKLVFFPEDSRRDIDPDYAYKQEQVGLADGFPFLIVGQEALNELNRRLPVSVSMNRFRPNFVFTGGEANEEDNWQQFKIGNNRFKGVKPCARCVLTTVDQQTGEKGIEPLATLATYRKRSNKIFFGQNLLALDYDEVFEGDTIVTIE